MSRQLSNKLLAEIYGQESSDPFLMLVTLSHLSFSSIYLVNNTVDIISNGNTFLAFPMKITLPQDNENASKDIRIEFDNVSRFLVDEIRAVTDPIDASIQMVLASDPDIVEVEIADLKISDISYNKSKISARLFLDDFLNTGLTSEKYEPSLYPGLFS